MREQLYVIKFIYKRGVHASCWNVSRSEITWDEFKATRYTKRELDAAIFAKEDRINEAWERQIVATGEWREA
jgi:hypothetical protein